MSDPRSLPPGIKRIESARDLDDHPVVRVELEQPLIRREAGGGVAIVGSPSSIRVLCALLRRQADLAEGIACRTSPSPVHHLRPLRLLRMVGDREE